MSTTQVKAISKKIRQLAALMGLSQAELSRRVGMQPSHLNIFFQGRGDLHSRRFVDLLFELGIDIDRQVTDAIARKSRPKVNGAAPVDFEEIIGRLRGMGKSEAQAISTIIDKISRDRKRAKSEARSADA